ncbi:D-tyrosyl-tRNA(Tyr) deacylase [Desulfurococcaceae archaeon AG1]|jgi:D-aminoacyl-tRNA deacylase|nr:MAG: D-tyrosyl-tRNA(Tyr) deacylase [Desulfurococcaceae archaeon]GAY25260.1 D-tyrosyl-tRNA(Tyr) deacylase [Desulfurococcaceae archaeon AG1]
MSIGFAYSVNDIAGRGIAEKLVEILDLRCSENLQGRVRRICGEPLRVAGFIDDVIYLEYLDTYFNGYSGVVVLSRHRAASGTPSLTVHYTGNPGDSALYGGRPWKLGVSFPSLGSSLLYMVNLEASSRGSGFFSISYEATHHGPTDNAIPVVFVEIGSSEKEWGLEEAHEIWARAIARVLDSRIECSSISIGLGGNHYPARFTELTLHKNVCFGHIIPRYVLKNLSENVVGSLVEQAILASAEKIEKIYMEEKAAQASKVRVIESVAEKLNIDLEIL